MVEAKLKRQSRSPAAEAPSSIRRVIVASVENQFFKRVVPKGLDHTLSVRGGLQKKPLQRNFSDLFGVVSSFPEDCK